MLVIDLVWMMDLMFGLVQNLGFRKETTMVISISTVMSMEILLCIDVEKIDIIMTTLEAVLLELEIFVNSFVTGQSVWKI